MAVAVVLYAPPDAAYLLCVTVDLGLLVRAGTWELGIGNLFLAMPSEGLFAILRRISCLNFCLREIVWQVK